MLSKIFRSQKSGHAAFLLMIASGLSYAAGLFRDRTLSHTFGATNLTDAYNASFLIPDFFFNLFIAGALSVAFVPVFASYLKIDKKEAETVANTILTFATIFLGCISVVLFFVTPYIVPLLFQHIPAEDHSLIISMTRIMLLSPILFAISNTLGSILITHKNFLGYAFSGFFYNIGVIIGIVLLNKQFGITGAAIGVIIGSFFHFLIRFLNILTVDYTYKPRLNLRHKGIKKIIKLMIPKSIGLLAWQVTLWVYTIVAFSIGAGSVAAFNYARNLQSFPVSLFGIAFATAIFPFLSDHAHHKDTKRFSEDFQVSLEKILFFSIPAAIGMLHLHEEIIELILKGGEFDVGAVILTAAVFLFWVIAIPFESCVHLFARAFYAYKNTFIPMVAALIGTGLIIFLAIYLAPVLGIIAIPIAFLSSNILQIIILSILVAKKISKFQIKNFLIKTLKIAIASLLMAVVVVFLPKIIELPFFIMLMARIIAGASIYLLSTYFMQCEELRFITKIFKRATSS